jgi:hypothetical protein
MTDDFDRPQSTMDTIHEAKARWLGRAILSLAVFIAVAMWTLIAVGRL